MKYFSIMFLRYVQKGTDTASVLFSSGSLFAVHQRRWRQVHPSRVHARCLCRSHSRQGPSPHRKLFSWSQGVSGSHGEALSSIAPYGYRIAFAAAKLHALPQEKAVLYLWSLPFHRTFSGKLRRKAFFGLLKSAGCYTIYGYQSFAGTAARP